MRNGREVENMRNFKMIAIKRTIKRWIAATLNLMDINKTMKKKSKNRYLPNSIFEKISGHVDGIGSVSLLTAMPYATARVSIPL